MTTQRSRAELTPGLAFPVNVAANQTRPPSPLQSPPFSSFRFATLTHATCLPSLTPVPLPFPSLSSPFLFLLSPFFLICFLYGNETRARFCHFVCGERCGSWSRKAHPEQCALSRYACIAGLLCPRLHGKSRASINLCAHSRRHLVFSFSSILTCASKYNDYVNF